MTMFMKAIVTAMVLFLVGCQTVPEVQTRYIVLEDHWLENCAIQTPPEKTAYVKATDRQRAVMMGQAYTGQLRLTTQCNVRYEQLRQYNEKAKQKNLSLER